TWHDLRSNAKAKKASILKHRNGTGGGSHLPENEQLTSVEDKIVDLVGPTAVSGDDKMSEPVVTFDFNFKIEYLNFQIIDDNEVLESEVPIIESNIV
ncbi:hypothetical protein RN001_002885, partial [Aquatica leii]